MFIKEYRKSIRKAYKNIFDLRILYNNYKDKRIRIARRDSVSI